MVVLVSGRYGLGGDGVSSSFSGLLCPYYEIDVYSLHGRRLLRNLKMFTIISLEISNLACYLGFGGLTMHARDYR